MKDAKLEQYLDPFVKKYGVAELDDLPDMDDEDLKDFNMMRGEIKRFKRYLRELPAGTA